LHCETRRVRVVAAAGAVTLATLLTAPDTIPASPRPARSPLAGHVSNEIPKVVVDRNAGKAAEAPLRINDSVYWEDLIRTVDLGRARLQLLDESMLNLGARSTMRIVQHDPQTQQTRLELTLGRVRAEVAEQTKTHSSFEMKTETATIGVVGTVFLAEAKERTTEVCGAEGVVRVRNLDPNVQGEKLLHAGECTRVDIGQPPRDVANPAAEVVRLTQLTGVPDLAAPVVTECVTNVSPERQAYERQAFDRVNEIRRQAGLRELAWSDVLAGVARRHACRMMALDFLEHVDPEYGELLERMSRAGLDTNNVGENVFKEQGHPDPGRYAIDHLMASPHHRDTILDPTFVYSGVGIAVAADGTYSFTEIFDAAFPKAANVP
jgi:uncharacterized protein YkwD